MNENNDFLNAYKKNADAQAQEQTTSPVSSSDTTDQNKHPSMIYQQSNGFERPRRYDSSSSGPASYRSYDSERSRTRRNMILAAAITLVVGIIGAIILFSNANKVVIPSFNGWSKNDFMLWASENKILTQIDEQHSETVESDKVISQSLAQGEKLKKGEFIRVSISLGPDLTVELSLPDIMSMKKAEIENWADHNFMTKVRITSEYHETIPVGKVIKYEINDNTVVDTVKRDTPIYVTLSKGPESPSAKEVTLPDFKTMGVSETVIFAQEHGLDLVIEERYDDYIPKNNIISQSVKKDDTLYPGDELTITVSLGQKKTMPSFKGLSKDEAMSKAAQLGVSVTIKERYSSSSEGRMIWQSIDQGTEVIEGMKLQLSYSLGSKIALGNYKGQQKYAFDQWLEAENQLGARLKTKVTYTQNAAASGTILQQSPVDTFIKRDTTINLVISTGKSIFVPDFVAPEGSGYDTAITREKAEAMNSGQNLILVFVSESKAGRLPGEIWDQSISPGKEVNEGTSITLKYNPVSSTLDMPDFTGQTQAQIEAMPEYSLLDITFVEGDYSLAHAGKIYSQSIAKSTTVPSGTSVTLHYSP